MEQGGQFDDEEIPPKYKDENHTLEELQKKMDEEYRYKKVFSVFYFLFLSYKDV